MSVTAIDSLAYKFYRSVKASTRCLIPYCGTTQNLEFHHVDPSLKKNTVSALARTGTLEEIIAEMRKCVPICTTHHKQIHSGQIKGWLKGQFDNGKASDDRVASGYLPFKPYFTGAFTREAA